MKKIIAFLLLACMMATALVSCGGNTDTPEETGEETKAEQPKEFVPEVIPASNINPRDIVVDYMYKMANIEWTPSKDIDFTTGDNKIHDKLYYKKGTKYHGIIYVTGSHTMVDYDEFMSKLNENGEYIGPVTKKDGWGNHCSSAIRLAYDRVQYNLSFGSTIGMVPSKKMGTIPVGDYTFEDSFTTTDEIIEANSRDVIMDSYTKLQKGDSILTCWGPTGHARMVISVKIERNNAGKINTGRSMVTCIEQTNSFDAQRKDGVNTTWYVEHNYTFNDLYEAKYIPLSIDALNVEAKDVEFTVKSINSPTNLLEGTLKGIIRNEDLRINGVTVDFVDKDGNVVATGYYENKNNDLKVFQFQNRQIPEEVKSLPAGDYTCYFTAHTLYGTAKVAKIDFTK